MKHSKQENVIVMKKQRPPLVYRQCGLFYSIAHIVQYTKLKGQCHKIFYHFFISGIEAIWVPKKQAKMVLAYLIRPGAGFQIQHPHQKIM